jgi:hypothetical protein
MTLCNLRTRKIILKRENLFVLSFILFINNNINNLAAFPSTFQTICVFIVCQTWPLVEP